MEPGDLGTGRLLKHCRDFLSPSEDCLFSEAWRQSYSICLQSRIPSALVHEVAIGDHNIHFGCDSAKRQLCTEAGANVEAAQTDGLHPLHCASEGGHTDVAMRLIEASTSDEPPHLPSGLIGYGTA